MEYGLFIVLMYGIIHAFGPDHLSAIALTSVGKSKKEVLIISSFFALSHGIVLFLLAKFLYLIAGSFILQYADMITWTILFILGLNLIYIGLQDNINLFEYENNIKKTKSRITIIVLGVLMGLGGLRGILVTLGAVSTTTLGFDMIIAFVFGTSIVFIGFGYLMFILNSSTKHNLRFFRKCLLAIGVISIVTVVYNFGGSYVSI